MAKKFDFNAHTAELADNFTNELGSWLRERLPILMSNSEFAATSSALMIALNRKLADAVVAFGETHGVDPAELDLLVIQMFQKNHVFALEAARGMYETVQ